ncbi:MAG: RNA polymerase sigma factor [Planctomycetes bacterium]|nr:RNA polymerase sigma factor [Planctomycetota bacterium]
MKERELYEQLVSDHYELAYRLAYRLSGDRDAAEDLVQETFYDAWRSIRTLKNPSSAKAWLITILRHRFYRWSKSCKKRKEISFSEVGHEFVAADKVNSIDQEKLQDALNTLDYGQREIFLLVYLRDLKCREVAEMLNLPLGTVLSRTARARQALYNYLLNDEPALSVHRSRDTFVSRLFRWGK